jgi:hypothetical protein
MIHADAFDTQKGGRVWLLIDGLHDWVEVYDLRERTNNYVFRLSEDDSLVAANRDAVRAIRHRA